MVWGFFWIAGWLLAWKTDRALTLFKEWNFVINRANLDHFYALQNTAHGLPILARFIPILRAFVPMLAGMSEMSAAKFT